MVVQTNENHNPVLKLYKNTNLENLYNVNVLESMNYSYKVQYELNLAALSQTKWVHR